MLKIESEGPFGDEMPNFDICGTVLKRQVQNTGHRSQVIVLLTQKVSQTPLKANLRPNKFLFRPN